MRFIVLGDVHFAYKSTNPTACKIFSENLYKFFDNVLFPYMKENHITSIIQTGDLFDSRKANSNIAVAEAKKRFFDKLWENNIDFHTIVGNHDIFYLHQNTPNAQSLYLKDYDNISIYDEPFSWYGIDMIPWINDTNKEEIFKYISNSDSKICVCHPEISGFKMNKESYCEHGLDRNIFSKYDLVIAGHFHEKSTAGNITYVGTPNQHNWGDVNSERGFHVLDTETNTLEFIKNPYNLFERIEYEDTLKAKDFTVQEKYVKIILPVKYDEKKYKVFLNELYEQSPHEIMGIETFADIESDVEVSAEQVESGTFDMKNFLVDYSISISEGMDRQKFEGIYNEIFQEI